MRKERYPGAQGGMEARFVGQLTWQVLTVAWENKPPTESGRVFCNDIADKIVQRNEDRVAG